MARYLASSARSLPDAWDIDHTDDMHPVFDVLRRWREDHSTTDDDEITRQLIIALYKGPYAYDRVYDSILSGPSGTPRELVDLVRQGAPVDWALNFASS